MLLGDGTGAFPTVRTVEGEEVHGYRNAVGIAVGDIDGDAIDDIVVANESGSNVAVHAGYGDGTFDQRQVRFGMRPRVTDVALADLDGDGILDVVSPAQLPQGGLAAAARTPAQAAPRPGLTVLFGQVPPCTARGTVGPDVLVGTPRTDVLCGFEGADVLRGVGGADILRGGDGDDRLFGANGIDVVAGAPGRTSWWGASTTTCCAAPRVATTCPEVSGATWSTCSTEPAATTPATGAPAGTAAAATVGTPSSPAPDAATGEGGRNRGRTCDILLVRQALYR